jgi:hypothetical protein
MEIIWAVNQMRPLKERKRLGETRPKARVRRISVDGWALVLIRLRNSLATQKKTEMFRRPATRV